MDSGINALILISSGINVLILMGCGICRDLNG